MSVYDIVGIFGRLAYHDSLSTQRYFQGKQVSRVVGLVLDHEIAAIQTIAAIQLSLLLSLFRLPPLSLPLSISLSLSLSLSPRSPSLSLPLSLYLAFSLLTLNKFGFRRKAAARFILSRNMLCKIVAFKNFQISCQKV